MSVENKIKLYKKILEIMSSVEYLKKDDTVGSGSYAYKGMSEAKVMQIFRDAFIQYKLIMVTKNIDVHTNSVESGNKVAYFTEVKGTYDIIDTETGESITIQSIGNGVDPQDKGAGKAMTYAHKYGVLKLFMSVTGDDADKIHSNDILKDIKDPTKDDSYTEAINTAKQVFGESGLKVIEDVEKELSKEGVKLTIKDFQDRCLTMIRRMYEGKVDKQQAYLKESTGSDTLKFKNLNQARVVYGKLKRCLEKDNPELLIEIQENWKK